MITMDPERKASLLDEFDFNFYPASNQEQRTDTDLSLFSNNEFRNFDSDEQLTISPQETSLDPQLTTISSQVPNNSLEKRRRNTLASARFRIKKKQKEKEMEERFDQIHRHIDSLKVKIKTLEMENKCLKELLLTPVDSKAPSLSGTSNYALLQLIKQHSGDSFKVTTIYDPTNSMATYSTKVFDHGNYESFRPSYPVEFLELILKYHHGPTNRLLDVGCGTGQVIFPFSRYFTTSIGVDPSEGMISRCKAKNSSDRLEFYQGKAENLNMIASASIDVLTAAECVHWMDPTGFLNEAARVLTPKGTLAFWLYLEPIFQDNVLNDIYHKYVMGDPTLMAPYWDEGKSRFYDWLKDATELISEDDRFENVELVKFDQLHLPEDKRERALKSRTFDGKPLLFLQKDCTLEEFLAFINTYSPLPAWYRANEGAKGTERDIMFRLETELRSAGVWEKTQTINWDTMYCFAKKK
ncbi:hypothetical protein KL949_003108 [Ogataea haglerorum]|nr:hypothetical protein KL913_002770 [Ogataea haglerorum]KAG7718136.1 hypothetical protein KL949_003108 [Ogataea haglerorum]KAG7760844.1 hypothetical protein KL947_000815 [Ogataea haglerorum]